MSLTERDIREHFEFLHGQQAAQDLMIRALLRHSPDAKASLTQFFAIAKAGGYFDHLSETARDALLSHAKGLLE
jgi:hypothetical protein